MPDLPPLLTSIVAGLPAAAAVIKTVATLVGYGGNRRAERHAKLIKEMPEGTKLDSMGALLNAELDAIAEHNTMLMHRRVDKSTVAVMVVLAALAAGVTYGGAALVEIVPGFWATIVIAVVVLIDLFFFLLIAIGGGGQLFVDKRTEEEKEKNA